MIPKFIDGHAHLKTTSPDKMEMALNHNASFLSIITNVPMFESIENQEKIILELRNKYPGRIQYITTFDFWDLGKEFSLKELLNKLKEALKTEQ